MEHLRLAIGLMGFLSVATFFVTCRLAVRASQTALDLFAVIILLLIAVYVYFFWGQLWIVNWIPLPSVIILSNWFPILLAMLAAILWTRQQTLSLVRRLPIQAALLGVTVWSVIYVIPQSPPDCKDKWIAAEPPVPYRICLQTTDHTCSAAAVATILETFGLEATEAEMARLCLTSKGTTWLGMYHGLSIKLWGTGYKAKFFEGSVDELAEVVRLGPVLLCCQLTEQTATVVRKYQEDDGWIPGVQHSVVCFGVAGDVFFIGDPSQKRMERWRRKDMINLWTGTGLMVVEP